MEEPLLGEGAEDGLKRPEDKATEAEAALPMGSDTGPTPDGRFLIVGMGASAGGLESFERFFKNLPADPGMAFVVVQHLDPDHESLMPDLLANYSAIPVAKAQDELQVEVDHVYVIPPTPF